MFVRFILLALAIVCFGTGLRAQTPAMIWARGGHLDSIMAVAVSPDLSKVASAAKDGTLKIWRYSTGELLETIRFAPAATPGLTISRESVAFSHDGNVVAVIPRVGGGLVRNLSTGAEWRITTADTPTTHVSVSRDGRYVAFVQAWIVFIWDRQTEQVTPNDNADVLRFTGSSDTLLLVVDGGAIRYDVATGQFSEPIGFDRSFPQPKCISPDGLLFAAVSADEERIVVSRVVDNAARDSVSIALNGLTACFTSDSRGILVSSKASEWPPVASIGLIRIDTSDGRIKLAEPRVIVSGHGGGGFAGGPVDGYHFFGGDSAGLGRLRFDATPSDTLTSHRAPVARLAVLPSDTAVISQSAERWQVWNAATGRRVRGPFGANLNAQFTERGPLAVVNDVTSPSRRVVELLSGDTVGSLPTEGDVAAFSDDGERALLTTDDEAVVVEARSGTELRRIDATWKRGRFGGFTDARLSPRGRWVVTHAARQLDPIVFIGPDMRVDSLSSPVFLKMLGFSPDEIEFYVESPDGAVHVLTLADASTRRYDIDMSISDFRFAGNDRVATLSQGTVTIWTRQFELIARLPTLHAEVSAIAPSSDGRRLTLALTDGTLATFDLTGVGSVGANDVRAHESAVRVAIDGHSLRLDRIRAGTLAVTLADGRGRELARQRMTSDELSMSIEIPPSIRNQVVLLHVGATEGSFTHTLIVGE